MPLNMATFTQWDNIKPMRPSISKMMMIFPSGFSAITAGKLRGVNHPPMLDFISNSIMKEICQMSTNIEWVRNPDGSKGETWNPVTGCTKISPGCENCYAERMARRLAGRFGYPEAPNHFNVTLHPDRLEQPLGWRKPRVIFVCSMGDLFHKDVRFTFISEIFDVMECAQQHTFQSGLTG